MLGMLDDDDNNSNNNNTTSNEDDNNKNNDKDNNVEVGNRPACSACKHQRKKCKKEECPMLKHFPAEKADIFSAVHKVFGVSNVSKIIKVLEPHEQERAVESLEWEALGWKKDKVHGPLGMYKSLEEQNLLIIEKNQKLFEQNQKLQEENRSLKEGLRSMQQSPTENCSNNAGVLAVQPGAGNVMNYYHGSGSLSLEPGITNAAQVSAARFLQDQRGREVLPIAAAAPYYDVNHAQAVLANMGSHHAGQSSRAGYSLANGLYSHYSTTHPSIDRRSSNQVMPLFGYPSPQQLQFINSGQRNTPDNR
nr:LOB domain-containing protein 6-like [Coffea arabica]